MTLTEATEIRNRINALRGLRTSIAAKYNQNELRDRFLDETDAEIAALNARLADHGWL